MLQLRAIAFVAAGIGFGLFIFGLALAFLVQPDCNGNVHCEKAKYDELKGQVLAIWILGVVLVAAGAAILLKQRMEERSRPQTGRPAPPAPATGRARLPPVSPPGPSRTGQARPPASAPRPPLPPRRPQ